MTSQVCLLYTTLSTLLILSNIARKFTTQTTGALLLKPTTYSVAAQLCASLNKKLWSPFSADFSFGLANALSYQAYLDPTNTSPQYWVSSLSNSSLCFAITTKGVILQKSCQNVFPVLCTNSGLISSAGKSDSRPESQVTVQSGPQHITGWIPRFLFLAVPGHSFCISARAIHLLYFIQRIGRGRRNEIWPRMPARS